MPLVGSRTLIFEINKPSASAATTRVGSKREKHRGHKICGNPQPDHSKTIMFGNLNVNENNQKKIHTLKRPTLTESENNSIVNFSYFQKDKFFINNTTLLFLLHFIKDEEKKPELRVQFMWSLLI